MGPTANITTGLPTSGSPGGVLYKGAQGMSVEWIAGGGERRTSRICRGAARRGFTLTELVVVLAILTIFAAVAVPRFARSSAVYRVDVSTHKIISDFDWARQRAKATGRKQQLLFYIVWDRYWLAGRSATGQWETFCVDLTEPTYGVEIESVDFEGNWWAEFDESAQCVWEGDVVLRRGEITRTIHLDKDTGKASLK
jgi:prepilin-type N-terminal cleavage/methylation domain-containing protein